MKFRIYLRSFDSTLIKEVSDNIKFTLLTPENLLPKIIGLPVKIERFCVLRSPHIDKDSREHFELRLYKSFFDLEIKSHAMLSLLLDWKVPSGLNYSLKLLKKK
jgi:small subunit ribosomal protein S10